MKYLLFLCMPVGGKELGPDEIATDPRFMAYTSLVRGRGADRRGARLRPGSDATTVRVRGGEVLLDDGPFAGADEYVAGIGVIEVADLDEAISLASAHPAALSGGCVEVRPVWE